MIPPHVRPLFWDTNLDEFDPSRYARYTIERVLEHGDEEDVKWLLGVFNAEQIRQVLRDNHQLSPKSAQFWALVFGVPSEEVPPPQRDF